MDRLYRHGSRIDGSRLKSAACHFRHPGPVVRFPPTQRLVIPLVAIVPALFFITPAVASPPSGPESPQELEVFIDGFWSEHKEQAHVVGLAFVLVRDGRPFIAKGYGHADLANETSMTPRTALRVGSVSKVVTAAAVMRLVEDGLIELDAPITRYLTDLDDRYSEPSTVQQLLTHTGGYDDTILRTHAPTLDQWRPLTDFLTELPPRALPPGRVLSYSSWDYALLGMIIERVSGRPYEQFIEERIFRPLGMADSTFRQPLPSSIKEKLAVGYHYVQGSYRAVPLDYVKISPGVALVSTVEDMAAFMLALLGEGAYQGARILEPATVAVMLDRQASHHPLLRGNTYGPVEVFRNDQRLLQQDGNGIGFTSRLALVPEHGFGFLISLSSPVFAGPGVTSSQNRFMRRLSEAIFDLFYPPPPEPESRRPSRCYPRKSEPIVTWARIALPVIPAAPSSSWTRSTKSGCGIMETAPFRSAASDMWRSSPVCFSGPMAESRTPPSSRERRKTSATCCSAVRQLREGSLVRKPTVP